MRVQIEISGNGGAPQRQWEGLEFEDWNIVEQRDTGISFSGTVIAIAASTIGCYIYAWLRSSGSITSLKIDGKETDMDSLKSTDSREANYPRLRPLPGELEQDEKQ